MTPATTPGLRPQEQLCLDALSRCRLLPASWEKRFIRHLSGVSDDYTLSEKQREWVWKLVQKYRRQLPGEVAALGTEGQRLLAAERQGLMQKSLDAGLRYEVALHDDPDDWGLRLEYADLLEEQGEDVLAAGQRWQATERKRPVWYMFIGGDIRWCWCLDTVGVKFPYASLPYEIWKPFGALHHTRHEAEAALARALAGGGG